MVPISQATCVAGMCSGDLGESSCVRTPAQSRAEIEPPRARGPYTARGDLSSATGLRAHALQSKPKRYLPAYGAALRPQRSRTDRLLRNARRTSTPSERPHGPLLFAPELAHRGDILSYTRSARIRIVTHLPGVTRVLVSDHHHGQVATAPMTAGNASARPTVDNHTPLMPRQSPTGSVILCAE